MFWPSIALLTFVTLQRLAELIYARHNTAALLAQGGREIAPGHYPYMVAMHTAWLVSLWLFATGRPVVPVWVVIFMVLQGLRVWVLATLKGRWTTRIIVLPREPLVRTGPYRFLNHPNYFVVVAEIALLPLVFGLVEYAVIFSLANALLLMWRIRAEDRALANRQGAV